MHPELVRLEEQYNKLIDDCQAGLITYDQALMSLENLSVIDGEGAVWGMDEYGHFFRRRHPGGPAEVCQPTQFVPSQLPPRGGGPQPTWDHNDLMVPPGQAPVQPPGQPHGAGPVAPYPGTEWPPVPGPQPAAGQWDAGHGGGPYPPVQQQQPTGPAATGFGSPQPKAARANPLSGLLGERGREFVGRNRRILIIGAIVLVLVGIVFLRSGGGEKEKATPNSTSATVATLPGNNPGSTPPAQPMTAVPSGDVSRAAASGITSGKRATVAALFATAPSSNQVALITATFAGARNSGVEITAGNAAANGEGKATQLWTMSDIESRQPVATATVSWVRDASGAWHLAAPPRFAAA